MAFLPKKILQLNIGLALVLSLLTLLVSSVPTLAQSVGNLVSNPSFESGTTSWTRHTNGGDVLFTIDSQAVDGVSSAKLTVNDPGNSLQFYQSGLTLEPNTNYTLSFSAKSNTSHDLSVYIHEHDQDYTNYGLSDYVVDLTSSWQYFSTTFTTKGFSTPVSDARLRFWFGPYDEAGDQYYIDNIILVKSSASIPGDTDGRNWWFQYGH